VLIRRYHQELRRYLGRPEWHDGTLKLWVEAYWPRSPNIE
jgi:hypothetical protein